MSPSVQRASAARDGGRHGRSSAQSGQHLFVLPFVPCRCDDPIAYADGPLGAPSEGSGGVALPADDLEQGDVDDGIQEWTDLVNVDISERAREAARLAAAKALRNVKASGHPTIGTAEQGQTVLVLELPSDSLAAARPGEQLMDISKLKTLGKLCYQCKESVPVSVQVQCKCPSHGPKCARWVNLKCVPHQGALVHWIV